MGPRLYFGHYFDLPPITQVVSKAQRVLGFQPTDFGEGLKETYRWYLRHHNHASPRLLLRGPFAGDGGRSRREFLRATWRVRGSLRRPP